MSEEELTFFDRVKQLALRYYYFPKKEEKEEEYHTIVFQKVLGEKREIEITFHYEKVVKVIYRAYLDRNYFVEIFFFPNFPSIDVFACANDNAYKIMSIDIKIDDIEKLLPNLIILDFPELFIFSKSKNSFLAIK